MRPHLSDKMIPQARPTTGADRAPIRDDQQTASLVEQDYEQLLLRISENFSNALMYGNKVKGPGP